MALTPQQKTALRAHVAEKALSHVGQVESPLYSNRGDLVDRCNLFVGNSPDEEPAWCLAHAVYTVAMAAQDLGLSLADTLVKKTGYCPDEYDHGKALGTLIDPRLAVKGWADVLPGDLLLVFYDSEGGGREPHHAELVITPPTKGQAAFTTVGGNTLPDGFRGDESRGYGVFSKHRNATDTNPSGHAKYVFLRMV